MTIAGGTFTAQGQFTMLNAATLTIDAGATFVVAAISVPGLSVDGTSRITVDGTMDINTSAEVYGFWTSMRLVYLTSLVTYL